LLKIRIGKDSKIESIPYGEKIKIGNANVSFHPAGHILGSSQVRIEVKGRIWVVSGDYKPQPDQTCEMFELVRCHGFISECTFGLPVYKWKPEKQVHDNINHWWSKNKDDGKMSLLFAYSLGKAQRVLAGLDTKLGDIYAHSAVHLFLEAYRNAGIKLPNIKKIDKESNLNGSIVIAPPAVEDSSWTKKFRGAKRGFASGWMAIRGPRRRKNIDRGFVLSDHADWSGLVDVITSTGAEIVKMTHGNGESICRFLSEKGINVTELRDTGFERGEME
jgi:putative mRNA 3-end processing factor